VVALSEKAPDDMWSIQKLLLVIVCIMGSFCKLYIAWIIDASSLYVTGICLPWVWMHYLLRIKLLSQNISRSLSL
jgi:hypothetical protein